MLQALLRVQRTEGRHVARACRTRHAFGIRGCSCRGAASSRRQRSRGSAVIMCGDDGDSEMPPQRPRGASASPSALQSTGDRSSEALGRKARTSEIKTRDNQSSEALGRDARASPSATNFFSGSLRRKPKSGSNSPTEFPVKVEVRGGVPIHLYTNDVDEGTRRQLENLARSKMPVGYVSAMPDVHLGKGATIGSVFASRDYVCPNAVGVDIGCGMCAVPLEGPVYRRDVPERKLLSIQRGLKESIPVGFDSHDRATPEMNKTVKRLVDEHEPTRWLRGTLSGKHSKQLGTLGGGNHFVELVYDEEDRIWMMLHSGSRNIGNVTATHYDEVAAKQCGGKPEALAYLKIKSKEGQEYLTDMTFCQSYALENRRFMMEAFNRVVKGAVGKEAMWDRMVNIHHNYCECEQCRYFDESSGEWREERLWVTRKGATSAKQGQLGIIPGSMGTGSYIVRGRGDPKSWQSCSHGAGRSLSRAQAFKQINDQAFVTHMKDKGILWDSRFANRVKDEAPMAYKDLNEVMRNQDSLVEIVHHLQPLINMKGF